MCDFVWSNAIFRPDYEPRRTGERLFPLLIRYLLAIAVLAFIYSMAQILRQVNRSRTGKDFVAAQYSWIVDFAGDQVGHCSFTTSL